MNHLSICSDIEHEKDPLDNFCITCHIEIVQISLQNDSTVYYYKESKYFHFRNRCLNKLNLNQEALDCLELGIRTNLSLEDTCNKIGDALRRLNKETDATDFYQTGNQIKKENIQLLSMKSEILQKQERFEEALICMEQLQDIDQNEYLGEKGYLLNVLNKKDEALQFYDQLLQKKEEGQEVAFNNKANILKEKKKFNEALKCYDAALKINPFSADALNGKGNTLQELHRLEEALKCYDAALKINPQNAEALNGKGNTLSKLHKLEEALKCYDAAFKINPFSADALNGKGNTLQELHRLEEALKCYDAALKINPQDALALNNKGNTLSKLHKLEEALKCYDAALKINPLQSEALNNKGNTLQELHRLEEALKCYDAALKINPQDAEALNNKGNTLYQLHRLEEALKCYDAALKIFPHHHGILKNKSILLYQKTKNNESIKSFENSLKINPQSTNFEEVRNIDLNCINQNKIKKNFSDYDINQIQTQERKIFDQDSQINKGKLLFQNNQFQEALIIFDQILAENQLPEIVFQKALTLFHLMRYEEALIYCDISESLGLYPNETAQLLNQILKEMTNFQ